MVKDSIFFFDLLGKYSLDLEIRRKSKKWKKDWLHPVSTVSVNFVIFTNFFLFSEFDKIYQRLDVTLIERGESFYHDMMPKVVADLERKGLWLLFTMDFTVLSQSKSKYLTARSVYQYMAAFGLKTILKLSRQILHRVAAVCHFLLIKISARN